MSRSQSQRLSQKWIPWRRSFTVILVKRLFIWQRLKCFSIESHVWRSLKSLKVWFVWQRSLSPKRLCIWRQLKWFSTESIVLMWLKILFVGLKKVLLWFTLKAFFLINDWNVEHRKSSLKVVLKKFCFSLFLTLTLKMWSKEVRLRFALKVFVSNEGRWKQKVVSSKWLLTPQFVIQFASIFMNDYHF